MSARVAADSLSITRQRDSLQKLAKALVVSTGAFILTESRHPCVKSNQIRIFPIDIDDENMYA